VHTKAVCFCGYDIECFSMDLRALKLANTRKIVSMEAETSIGKILIQNYFRSLVHMFDSIPSSRRYLSSCIKTVTSTIHNSNTIGRQNWEQEMSSNIDSNKLNSHQIMIKIVIQKNLAAKQSHKQSKWLNYLVNIQYSSLSSCNLLRSTRPSLLNDNQFDTFSFG
jgi:hypothetical protein